MADHKGYWTEVGREVSGLVRRVKPTREENAASARLAVKVLLVFAVLVLVSLFGVFLSSPTSLAEAPEGNVPGYEVVGEETIGAALSVDVEIESEGVREFRLIAEDLRYRNPEYDKIFVDFQYPGYGFTEGSAVAVATREEAEEWWGEEHTDEEIDRIVDEYRGVEARAPYDIFD